MTTLEVLRAARDLISDPARWTREEYARTANGTKTYTWHDDAYSFCAIGAIRAIRSIAHTEDTTSILAAQQALAQPIKEPELSSEEVVTHYNDAHTHAEVLALFDAAIARLEAEAHP